MVSQRDEMYGHQADIEFIMMNLEDKYRYSILKDYKNSQKKDRNSKEIDEALKFLSYFDIKHLNDSNIIEFKEEEGFINLVSILKSEKQWSMVPLLSFDKYQLIVSSNYAEENEIIEVIEQTTNE